MSFIHNEDYDAFREHAARWVEKTVRPALAKIDQDVIWTPQEEEAFYRGIDVGGFTSKFPEGDDGQPDWMALWVILEELGKASAAVSLTLNHRLATSATTLKPIMTPEQLELFGRYLNDGVGMSGGITEPSGGSNPAGMHTLAVRKGDKWVINGRKMWISSASQNEAMFVTCRTREEGEADGFGMFFVERKHGWEARPIPMVGMTLHTVCDVVFEDVEVPLIAKLDPPKGAMAAAHGVFLHGRVTLAMICCGLAQEAFDKALAYSKERDQWGRKIAGFQLIQGLLSEMATDISCGRLLAWDAANCLTKGEDGNGRIKSSMAKMFCSEMAVRVASNAIQIHGALGLAKEADIERLWRDARMFPIPDGPTQIQQLIIGRELTGINALRG